MRPAVTSTGGLAGHLAEALRLNAGRLPGYARRGGPRALALSTALIASEVLALPAAWGLDRSARPFARRGVPVVSGDVVPMDGARPAEAPVSSGVASDAEHAALRGDVRSGAARVRRELRRPLPAALGSAAGMADDLVATVEAAQRRAGAAWPLTLHVAESLRFVLGRGVGHAAATDGASAVLTRRLARLHLPLAGLAVRLDRAAQPLHARGVGIFVNDLPPIPRP